MFNYVDQYVSFHFSVLSCSCSCYVVWDMRRTGNWPRLAAADTALEAETTWLQFWRNYERLYPSHEIYDLARAGKINLAAAAALAVHGDEGRGRKRAGVLCLSTHSLLGAGWKLGLALHPSLRKPVRNNK